MRSLIHILFILVSTTALSTGCAGSDGERGPAGPAGPAGPGGASGQDSVGNLPLAIQLPGDDFFPEGIALSDTEGEFFIGSMTSGEIVVANADTLRATRFSPPETLDRTAVGLLADDSRGILWVCDADFFLLDGSSVVGLDLVTGALAVRHEIAPSASGAVFCNDLALDQNGDLYVTDTFGSRVLRIPSANALDADSAQVWVEDEALGGLDENTPFGANGIYITESYVWVVNIGRSTFVRITINSDGTPGDIAEVALTDTDGEPTLLIGPDGLKSTDDFSTFIVVEQLGGFLSEIRVDDIDAAAPTATVEVLSSRLDRPTTVAYSLLEDRAYVVEGQFDHLFTPEEAGPPLLPFGVVTVDLFSEL